MFVLLGIIILIVSFIVALISLIREQKELEDINSSMGVPPVAQTDVAAPAADVTGTAQIVKSVPSQQQEIAAPEQQTDETVPFPWEQNVSSNTVQPSGQAVPQPVGPNDTGQTDKIHLGEIKISDLVRRRGD